MRKIIAAAFAATFLCAGSSWAATIFPRGLTPGSVSTGEVDPDANFTISSISVLSNGHILGNLGVGTSSPETLLDVEGTYSWGTGAGNKSTGTATGGLNITDDIIFSSENTTHKIQSTRPDFKVGLRLEFGITAGDEGIVIGSAVHDHFRVAGRSVIFGSFVQGIKSGASGTDENIIIPAATLTTFRHGNAAGNGGGITFLEAGTNTTILGAGIGNAIQFSFHNQNISDQGLRLRALNAAGTQTDGSGAMNRLVFRSDVQDSANAVAFEFDTDDEIFTAGSKIFTIKNKTTDYFTIVSDGEINIGPGVSKTTFTAEGHVRVFGPAPALTSCGTTPGIVGTDRAGKVTIGATASSTCTLTFDTAYLNAPACTAMNGTVDVPVFGTTTTTTLVLTDGAGDFSDDVISYICIGL